MTLFNGKPAPELFRGMEELRRCEALSPIPPLFIGEPQEPDVLVLHAAPYLDPSLPAELFRGEQPETEEPDTYAADDALREMQSWSDSKLRAELREAGFVRLEALSRKELLAMLAGVRAAKVKRNAADEARVKESPPEPALTILDVKKAIAEEIKAQPERVMVTEILRDECGRPRKTIHRLAKEGEF